MNFKELVNELVRYPHLFNPAYAFSHKGQSLSSAPKGRLRLAKDDKLNLSLWNAIYAAAGLAPLAFIVNAISNKKAESAMEDASDKASVAKLNALRPRVVADASRHNTKSFTELPRKELKQLDSLTESLEKVSSEGENSDNDNDFWGIEDWAKENLSSFLSNVAKSSIPFVAAPTAVLGAIALSNKLNRDRIKNKLKDQRTQYRKIQAAIDRKALQEAGLIKSAANRSAADRANKKDEESAVSNLLFDLPGMLAVLATATLGLGAFNTLRAKDKNLAKIKYFTKRQAGSNILQDTPNISILDIPANPDEILLVPGDKKQQTIANSNKPVALLENKELFSEVSPARSKKREIF